MTGPGMRERDLFFDWNQDGGAADARSGRVEVNDETLRDGLQSPAAHAPAPR